MDIVADKLRIAELMRLRGITAPQLAAMTGIKPLNIYRYMANQVEPPLLRFTQIRIALGVTPGEMYEGTPITSIGIGLPDLVAA